MRAPLEIYSLAERRARKAERLAAELAAYARSLGHPRPVLIEDPPRGPVRNLRREEFTEGACR